MKNTQTITAVGMLVAGLAFAVAGFITPPPGEISDSVLWLFSQCLIYAGSIFGVGIYVDRRFSAFTKEFRRSGLNPENNTNEQPENEPENEQDYEKTESTD